MTIDVNSLMQSALKPATGFATVLLLVVAAYLADCYFSRSARR